MARNVALETTQLISEGMRVRERQLQVCGIVEREKSGAFAEP